VEIVYSQHKIPDYLDECVSTVLKINVSEPVPGFFYLFIHFFFLLNLNFLGDVLVFVGGVEEIEDICSNLRERGKRMGMGIVDGSSLGYGGRYKSSILSSSSTPKGISQFPSLLILPIYAAMPAEEQALIFVPTPPNTRKVLIYLFLYFFFFFFLGYCSYKYCRNIIDNRWDSLCC
jgi:HrpA-like RNA helicase